jgi:hypothetical protein
MPTLGGVDRKRLDPGGRHERATKRSSSRSVFGTWRSSPFPALLTSQQAAPRRRLLDACSGQAGLENGCARRERAPSSVRPQLRHPTGRCVD